MEKLYLVDNSMIMHQEIDGEVVIVNLDNGYYYNLDNLGAQLWQLIVNGHSPAGIQEQMQLRYSNETVQVTAEVGNFFSELEAEGLVTCGEGLAKKTPITLPQFPYITPQLQKYTDMDSLLMLDPIHEVDEGAGWPHQA